MDQIFILKQLLERTRGLWLLLVNFEKAFDSVELNFVLLALAEEGINGNCVVIDKEVGVGCSTEFRLFIHFAMQSDPLSSKLFTASIKMMIFEMNWGGGVNVNGEIIYASRMMKN